MNQNDVILVPDYSSFMDAYVDECDSLEHMDDDNFLSHHGVKEMKWHHRRWQYPDGSLTPAGREHYGVGPPRTVDPDHPIASRVAKAAQGFKERRAIAKIRAEKEERDRRLQEGKRAAKLKREQRAKEVAAMTKTPEDLVKNRSKLSEEEFNAAVERFERLKKIDTDNKDLLKRYQGLSDEDADELARRETNDDDDEEFNSGMHWGTRRFQNEDGTLTEEGKAYLEAKQNKRAKELAKLTRTAEDLVKNRDKLSEQEFKEAVIRFDRERQKKEENQAILNAFGGKSDFEARREARSAEKIAEAYRKYNATSLLKHRGEFTKEEFDKLKVLIASKSTSDLKKLTTYLSADEYMDALDRYSKTEGARKNQVQSDINNISKTFKSAVDVVDSGYKVANTATKLTTGRDISELAKNATGRKFMSLLEEAQLDNELAKARASEAAKDAANKMVDEMGNVFKRAKNLSDKEYADVFEKYYDDTLDILAGNGGGKNKKGKGNNNQNNQNNQNKQEKQSKQDKKKAEDIDKHNKEPFPTYENQKGTGTYQEQDNSNQQKKKDKKEKQQQQTSQPKSDALVFPSNSDDLLKGKPTLYTIGNKKAPTLSFDTTSTSSKDKKEKQTTPKTTTLSFDSEPSRSAPTLSFDSPSSSTKKKQETPSGYNTYTPKLTFGDQSVSRDVSYKPMTDKEYNDVMTRLAKDVADFRRTTNNTYVQSVTVDDVYDEVMRKLWKG